MKILQVVDQLNIGGAERVIVDLSNLLSSVGITVSVLSLLSKGPLSSDLDTSIPQIELHRQRKWSISSLKSLYEIAKDFDIIHVHMRHNARYVCLCKFFFPLNNVKIIYHEHNGTNLGYDFIDRRVFHYGLDGIIVVSNQLCSIVKNQGFSCVFCLPNIIQCANIVSTSTDRKGIVAVGNIRPQKNYEFLAQLAKVIPTEEFHIYGNKSDSAYFDRVVSQLPPNVKIHTGLNQIQPELYKYKLAVHVAEKESGPLVLIEYLANRLPFVAYNTGEVVRKINMMFPMFVMSSFSIDEWVQRILYVMNIVDDIAIKEKMFLSYKQLFSPEKYISECVEIYKIILHS